MGGVRVTFGGVAGLVLAPVAEDLVFDPGHVFRVGVVVLLLGPLRHACGCCLLFVCCLLLCSSWR